MPMALKVSDKFHKAFSCFEKQGLGRYQIKIL